MYEDSLPDPTSACPRRSSGAPHAGSRLLARSRSAAGNCTGSASGVRTFDLVDFLTSSGLQGVGHFQVTTHPRRACYRLELATGKYCMCGEVCVVGLLVASRADVLRHHTEASSEAEGKCESSEWL
jgi:hypothetical protein